MHSLCYEVRWSDSQITFAAFISLFDAFHFYKNLNTKPYPRNHYCIYDNLKETNVTPEE